MRRNIVWTFAILALVVALVVDATATDTERITQTVKLDPGGTLRLRSFSGQVTINASDRPEVVIDAVRRADRARLNRIKLDIHSEGSTVVVDANRRERSWWEFFGGNNVVETDFDIKVPRRTNLDISVFSAPVTVHGVEGSYKVHGFSSRLRLEDAVGPIRAHTFSGAVEIRAKAWQDEQAIEVDTFSGGVTLHVPESAHGTITFNSFSGQLTADVPLTLERGGRNRLTARLGNDSGGGRLRVKTFSGNVRIDR